MKPLGRGGNLKGRHRNKRRDDRCRYTAALTSFVFHLCLWVGKWSARGKLSRFSGSLMGSPSATISRTSQTVTNGFRKLTRYAERPHNSSRNLHAFACINRDEWTEKITPIWIYVRTYVCMYTARRSGRTCRVRQAQNEWHTEKSSRGHQRDDTFLSDFVLDIHIFLLFCFYTGSTAWR